MVEATHGVVAVNEVYDPVTDTWSTKTPIPLSVSAYASAVVDGKIYVIGGLSPVTNSTSTSRVNLNQIYDPNTDTWSLGELPCLTIKHRLVQARQSGVIAPKHI